MSSAKSNLVFCIRYADPATAVDWLCDAFGARRHFVAEGDTPGDLHHAQLVIGNSMIMVGPWRDDEFGALQTIPSQAGGKVTASPYLIVADADAHHARAVAAGARIAIPPRDEDYGGRGYSCFDPEGHLWNFGTFNPWA
jgi:uncharacterized glyoxalase superfamily protein PhnB